jgi:hypothetical protein
MKVVPSRSTALLKLNVAIELSGGSSMNTRVPAVSVLLPSPPRDTPEVVGCRWDVAEIRNLKVQATQGLGRFGLQCA